MTGLRTGAFLAVVVSCAVSTASAQGRLQTSDFLRLRSVTQVQLSPDGSRAAYVVENNDGAGRPYGQVWIMTVADGKATRLGGEKESSADPVWSPDGQSLAYRGRMGDKSGLIVARVDGS